MRVINKKDEFQKFYKEKGIRIVYLSTNTCCACGVLKPKIEDMIKKYDNVEMVEIEADKSVEIVSQLGIFMFPAFIMYIDGKEVLREAKYISVVELEKVIDRYFKLYQ